MADREKVIKVFECCLHKAWEICESCPYHVFYPNNCIDQRNRDAIEILKEQEPAKPILRIDTWICPKCGHNLESQELIDDTENPQVLIHELYNYCPNCGKPVKWDDKEVQKLQIL